MERACWVRHFSVAWLIFAVSFLSATTSAQPTSPQITQGLNWLQTQVSNDGSLAGESASIATAFQARTETVLTLRTLATTPASLVDGLAPLAEDTTEYLSRQIVANVAAGRDVTTLAVKLAAWQNADGGFGGASGYWSTPLDTAWAAYALAQAGLATGTAAQTARAFLIAQAQVDGGIGTDDTKLRVEATALAVMALRGGIDFAAASVADAAANWLKSQMTTNGAWLNEMYSTAVAWLALGPVTVESTTRSNVTAYLLSGQVADGSWSDDPFLTAIVLRSLSSAAAPSSVSSTLTGRIIEQGTGSPVFGVTVVAQPSTGASSSAMTGSDGRFSISNLSAGSYNLTLSKTGYVSATASLALSAGQQLALADISLAVTSNTGIVRGTVRAAATNAPIGGATVTIAGTPARSATTNSIGFYEILSVPSGAIQLTASATGYINASGSGTLPSGGVIVFAPTLYATSSTVPGPATMSGQVRASGTGALLGGVAVKLNGVTKTTTNIDGRFSLSTAAGSYGVEYALGGYNSAFQTIVVSAGALLDVGVVELSAIRTTSRISGVVTQPGGAPLNGAVVAVQNGPSVTTGSDGSYALNNLVGTSFTLSISATGFNSQAYTLQVAIPADVVQSFTLVPLVQGNLQFAALNVVPSTVQANARVDATALLSNNSGTGAAVAIVLQIRDANDALVSKGAPVDAADLGLGVVQLDTGQTTAIKAKWNSAQFAPGTYTLVLRAVAAGTLTRTNPDGQVLAETRGALTITPDPQFAGTITADPPVQRAGSATPIKLSSVVQNSGNAALAAQSFQLLIVNSQSNAQVYSQAVSAPGLAVGALATLTFPDWLPAVAGNYALTLTSSAGTPGAATAMAYVGDSASAVYTVDRALVGPGTQTVKGTIVVTGQDAVSGAISDPLAPLIKTAIQKAVTINDASARQWAETNRCSSCHIGNQALAGGELARRAAPNYNLFDRTTILNNVATNQAPDGGLYQGHSSFRNALGSLSLWGLSAYHNLSEYRTVLKKAADWAFAQQASDGHWANDYATGWWDSDLALTSINLKSLITVNKELVASGLSSVPTYATASLIPTFTLTSRGFLARSSAGNLYFSQLNTGKVYLLRPDGVVLTTWQGLTDPQQAIERHDGQVWLTSGGGVYRLNADGTQTKLSSDTVNWMAVAPDGSVYATRWQDRTIYKLDDTGHATVWLANGPFTWPAQILFDDDGSMLIPDGFTFRITRVKPDKSTVLLAEMIEGASDFGTNAQMYGLQKDGDHWLLSTINGIYRFSANWEGQRLTYTRADQMVRLDDGSVVYAAYNQAGIQKLIPQTVALAPSLANYQTGASRAATWLTNLSVGANENLHLAQRLWGLGEAYNFYLQSEPTRAATIQTKMNTLATQLRTNQNSDGGWGRNVGNASDSMVTAQVGIGLDYVNPSPADPAIRKAVTWLLSRQQADGSWISENAILTTHVAATTWVMNWLPVILDRLGGIDTGLIVTFPPNVTMSGATIAPNTVETIPSGEQRYTWALPSVTTAGREINFNLSLVNMQLGEQRAVSSDAHLSFTNTFTGGVETAPIVVPRVTASAFLSLGVGTDHPAYPANSVVNITSTVANSGTSAQSGSVRVDIVGTNNFVVASAGTGTFAGLAVNAITNVLSTWNTGTTAAGNYTVLATLYDSAGRQVTTARAAFVILAETVVGAPTLTSAITTDKQAYLAYDRVLINARVQSQTPNFTFENLTVTESVTNSAGNTVFTASQPLVQLLPNAIRDLQFPQTLNNAPAGVYTVRQQVADANNVVLDTRITQYTVQSSAVTGSGLKGTIAAAPKQSYAGDPITFTGSATNLGNAALNPLPLTVVVLNPDTSTTVAQWPYTANLARNASFAIGQGWTTAGVSKGNYVIALIAVVGGNTLVLAQDTFTVLEQPVKLSVTQGFAHDARVLVLIACDNSQNNGQVAACVAQRASYVDAYLTALAIEHKIVTDVTSFTMAFRGGRYNTYWLSGSADQLDATIAGEVVEAVNGGDAFVMDGVHDQRNHLLDPLLGVNYRGKQPTSTTPVVTLSSDFLPRGSFNSTGDGQSAQLTTGTRQAVFSNGDPAIVTSRHGVGRTLLYAFDLVATLQAQPTSTLLRTMVNSGFCFVTPPTPLAWGGRAYVPISTVIGNQGIAADVEVTMTVPNALSIVGATPSVTSLSATRATWRFSLPVDGTQTLGLALRAPIASGHYTVQTQVSTVRAGVVTPYSSLNLDVVIAAADQGAPQTVASLEGLSPAPQQEKQARDKAIGYVQAALTDMQQNKPLVAIQDYLRAIGELAKITTISTANVELAIDTLLKEAERVWYLASGGT